ncbi:MAG: hypothetical protein WA123_10380 [Methylotenera sp.]
MSILTFTLHKKTLTVSARDGTFTEKLSFEARLPKRDSLSTHEGKQVKTGYVELVFEKPEYETEKIHFIDASEDIDTGSIYPPSVSFYAKVTPDIFALIRDSNPNALLSLRLQTEMMGPIQFNDPMGEAKLWDTSRQNPVVVESYEITLSQSE